MCNGFVFWNKDSIVRGTQMRGLMDYLFSYGAKELHGRIACPPVLYGCKYLNFTRASIENETIARKVIAKLEGTNLISDNHVAHYADPESKQYRNMVDDIQKNLNLLH